MITPEFLQSCTDEQISKGVAWLEVVSKGLSMQYNPDSEFYYYWCNAALSNPNKYCTNPNDAWPIMMANNIDIRHNYEELNSHTALIGDDEDYLFWTSGPNPLRNAMEVYILMSVKS